MSRIVSRLPSRLAGAAPLIAVTVVALLAALAGAAQAAFPGLNGDIAFTSDRDGAHVDLFGMDATGGSEARLTAIGIDAEDPAWSPDGSRIAFVKGSFGIFTFDVATEALSPVTGEQASGIDDHEPAWSPDGSMIAFSRGADPQQGIWRVNLDGTGLVRLTDGLDHDPAWSPDGGSIVFSRHVPFGDDIYAMNPDGAAEVRLSVDGIDFDPTWSPDGNQLAFVKQHVSADIYALDVNDPDSQTVLTDDNVGNERAPAWSPDGSKIVYESAPNGGDTEISVTNADGSGGETQLTNNTAQDASPDWQRLPASDGTSATCAIGNTRVEEGDSGTSGATFEVDCDNPTDTTSAVDYTTSDGTAHRSADYTTANGSFSVPPGASHAQIAVTVRGDSAPEPHETFRITLDSPDVTIARPTATATIVDDDGFGVTVATASHLEGDSGSTDVDLQVRLSDTADQPVNVYWIFRSTSAQAGVDYDIDSRVLTFAPGETSQVIAFQVIGDTLVEGNETIQIVPASRVINDADIHGGGLTITDDDDTATAPTISIEDASVQEGDTGTTSMPFKVRLSAPSDKAVTVDYLAADGSAAAPDDYAPATGTVTFAPGETSRPVTIGVAGDVLDETDESLTVDLSKPVNATIADGSGEGSILDDDAPPAISINSVTVNEGDAITTPMVFTVSLPAPSGKTVRVAYATSDGSATALADYAPGAGDVVFPPGETAQTVTIDIVGDALDEPNETFTVSLSGADNASILDATGTGTITDDDLAISSVRLAAGGLHTCALTTAGGAKCWGSDYSGALGDGHFSTSRATAVDVVGLSSGVAAISAGSEFTCAVTTSGGAQCWGANDFGQLGDGSGEFKATPVPVVGLSSGVVSITTGLYHACALTSSGAVKCWGGNNLGQLGDGTTTSHPTPVSVVGLSDGVTAINAGSSRTCAVTTSGAAMCWGALGQGSEPVSAPELTPVSVSGLSGPVAAVGVGIFHACALTIIGGVECWGEGILGQLGDGRSASSAEPVPVTGLSTGVVSIAAGFSHTCALMTSGTVECWGTNTFGFGDGTSLVRPAPVVIPGAAGSVAISTHWWHTCALASDVVKCWGANGFGEGGNGGFACCVATPSYVLGFGSDISIDDATVAEGDAGTTQATFTVSLSVPSDRTLTVDYATADGSATAGADYTSASGTLTFLPGVTTREVTIDVRGDTTVEADETFTVNLSNPAAAIADASGVATITNDDLPTISIRDPLYSAREDSASLIFMIEVSPPSDEVVRVDYTTVDGTATTPADYRQNSGTVAIPPGGGAGIYVYPVPDLLDEPNETVTVQLSNSVNATIADGSATGTIIDDDEPTITIDDVTVTEGDSGTTPATFTVSLSTPSTTSVTVAWGTLGFDANAGPDYDAGSGMVTFEPGDISEAITVNVVGDPVVEADETFLIDLGNAVGATIADDSGTGTIVNDDVYADVSIGVTADHDASTRPVGAGQRLVYTLAVTNHGPGPAVNIRITDGLPHTSIPNDAMFCEVAPPATTCDTSAGMPYGDATSIPMISALGAGVTRTYQIGYTVERGAPSGPMANTASITTYSSDANQSNDSSTVTVRVDALPIASFAFSPTSPVIDGAVTFDGTGTTDDGPIASYAWTFGDGGTGTGASTTHAFTTARTYTVTLTVTDAVGGIGTTTHTVVVSGAPPPPSAHRVLRGTVTRLVPFGPGGGPAGGGVPLAGATVRVTTGPSFVEVATDAQGGYVFPNLVCPSNRCPVRVTEPGSTTVLATQTVDLGPDPSTTTLDLKVGTALDQLVLSGRVLAPASPPAVAPTIAIRVYRGTTTVWVADSAELFGGPGGYGAYQFALARVGSDQRWAVGVQLRVVLLENGVPVASTFVTIPPRTGAAVPVQAADLTAIAPPPSAHRVLRGTVTRLVPFGPGGGPAGGGVPLAGATVRVTTGPSFVEVATDAQGGYVFPNLVCPSNRCPVRVTEPGSTTVLATQTVDLGPDPSTTTLDLKVGTALDQLVLSGRVLAPASPPAVAPTIAIRVYRGTTTVWVADSAELFGGPGGYGAYQFALARVGSDQRWAVGVQLRVVLLENGVPVASTFVTIPPRTGAAVPVQAADLTAIAPPPSAHRVLRGTVTRLVPFGPGGGPAGGGVPLAGATVRVTTGPSFVEVATDAQGGYVFPNLVCPSNRCPVRVTEPGSTTVLATQTVDLGPDPSTTTLDLKVGTALDQLVLSGRVLAPASPPAVAPTIAIRVYRGTTTVWVADSAELFGGPGGYGAYQFALARVGSDQRWAVGVQLRVVLLENGVPVASTFVTIPPRTGAAVPVQAADLQGL